MFDLIDASLHDFLNCSHHASTNLDEVAIINCTSQPANQIQDLIVSITESYKNGTHSQVALILHHLKDFINSWPLNYCCRIVRYFYLVVRVAYRQFCVFYFIFMFSLNDFYMYFMHINVSGRSVLLLFNTLICQ